MYTTAYLAAGPRDSHASTSRRQNEYDDPAVVQQATLMYDAIRLLSRCASLYGALHQAEASQRLNLSATDVKALEMIGEFDALTIGQLMQLTGLSAGGTTAVVDRLEQAGFIARDKHPHDRRVTVLRPVPARWSAVRQSPAANRLELTGLHHVIDEDHWESIQLFLNRALEALHHEAGQHLAEATPPGRDTD